MAVSPRDAPTPPESRTSSRGEGLEVSTLVITALASAGAALVSSELLGSGTLISAALTPVVIALLKEALDRPRRVVSEVVPVVVRQPRRRPRAPGAPPDTRAEEPPVPRQGEVGEVHVYRSKGRRWRLAAVTGLLGFVLAAAVLTVTELAAGGAVAGGSRATTYFGGGDRSERSDPSEREEERAPAEDPARSEPSTAPDPSTSTPEAPTVPEGEAEDVPPATGTAPAPATPADPAQPAPAPGTPAPEAAPATPAPAP